MVVPIIAGAAARVAGGAAARGAAGRAAAGRATAGRAGQGGAKLSPTRTGGTPKPQQQLQNLRKVTEQFGGQKQVRITAIVIGCLTVVALIFDGLQFLFSFLHMIPWIGNSIAFVVTKFLALVSFIVFGLWFALLRVSYFNGKQALMKVMTALGTVTVEMIPLLDALPAITLGVLVMVVASRLEDAAGNPDEEKKAVAQRQATAQVAANDNRNQERAYVMAQMQEEQQRAEMDAMMAEAANDEFNESQEEYASQRRVQQMVDIVPRRPAASRVTSEMVRAELGKRAA